MAFCGIQTLAATALVANEKVVIGFPACTHPIYSVVLATLASLELRIRSLPFLGDIGPSLSGLVLRSATSASGISASSLIIYL